jgi:arginine utilization protein RocB
MTFAYLHHERKVTWNLSNIFSPNIMAAYIDENSWCDTSVFGDDTTKLKMAKVVLKWVMQIKGDTSTTIVLDYTSSDSYIVDMTDESNEDAQLDKLVKESNDRYVNEYNIKRADTIFKNHSIGELNLIDVREGIKKFLRQAGC